MENWGEKLGKFDWKIVKYLQKNFEGDFWMNETNLLIKLSEIFGTFE